LNLGAKRIVELAQKLEELGRAGNLDEAPSLLKDLEMAYIQTRAHLLPMRQH
jgi:HPt (histidine-containing phosphotransfer) domain-containing protein